MASSETTVEPNAPAQQAVAPQREVMYRHTVAVRLTHWINALILVLLLISGLRLFNYHPALYWGDYGYSGVPSFFSIAALEDIVKASKTGQTIELTIVNGSLQSKAKLDYHEGAHYPMLERIPSRPDTLSQILAPQAGR